MSYSREVGWTCDLCGKTLGTGSFPAALLPPAWNFVLGQDICENHKILVDPPEEKPEPESQPSTARERQRRVEVSTQVEHIKALLRSLLIRLENNDARRASWDGWWQLVCESMERLRKAMDMVVETALPGAEDA